MTGKKLTSTNEFSGKTGSKSGTTILTKPKQALKRKFLGFANIIMLK